LYEDLEEVWQAFHDLNLSRQTGFGPSALSVKDITAWMDLHEIQDRSEFYELIVAMDSEWMNWAMKKQESRAKNGNLTAGSRRQKFNT
jgi:hypothetical protein